MDYKTQSVGGKVQSPHQATHSGIWDRLMGDHAEFSLFHRYAGAIGLVAIAILIESILKSFFNQQMLFVYLTATAIGSLLYGSGPALLSTFLGALSFDVLISGPEISSISAYPHLVTRLIIFTSASLLVTLLGGKLRSTLDRLREEREFREYLVAGLAHDLRNPIGSAKMTIDLMSRHSDPKSALQLKRASVALDRADNFIQDFLDVSRRQSGKYIQLKKEVCSPDKLLREVVDEYDVTYPGRVTFEPISKSQLILCDKRAIRRILENLISNGLKYGTAGSEVTVSMRLADTAAISFSVRNRGIPIPQHEQERIFCRFERSSRSSAERGWGLGLATVKVLAEAHGGTIDIKSNPDVGTVFTVRLPISVDEFTASASDTCSSF